MRSKDQGPPDFNAKLSWEFSHFGGRELTLKIHLPEAFLLMGALQLAHRHPMASAIVKEVLKETVVKFQDYLRSEFPSACQLLERGWQEADQGTDDEDLSTRGRNRETVLLAAALRDAKRFGLN